MEDVEEIVEDGAGSLRAEETVEDVEEDVEETVVDVVVTGVSLGTRVWWLCWLPSGCKRWVHTGRG